MVLFVSVFFFTLVVCPFYPWVGVDGWDGWRRSHVVVMYGDELANSLVGCPSLPLGFGVCRCFCGDEVTRVLVPAVMVIRGDGGCFAPPCVFWCHVRDVVLAFPLGLVCFGCLVCRWAMPPLPRLMSLPPVWHSVVGGVADFWCGVFGSCFPAVVVVKCCLWWPLLLLFAVVVMVPASRCHLSFLGAGAIYRFVWQPGPFKSINHLARAQANVLRLWGIGLSILPGNSQGKN
ncbi:unnamed protein product [Absidia cylindrospora]